MQYRRLPVWLGCSLLAASLLGVMPTERSQRLRADETAAEEDRERALMERFLTLLERTPRRGTALDRVYAYHADRGTLDALLARFRDRAAKDEKDGLAWMLIGLLEAKRGRDAAAVAALRQAAARRPGDPLAPYYLGQSLVLAGQPEAAVEAFEQALKREPGRADLLEIFQALGRVHQRAHRFDQALDVWTRLEGIFPGDPRVQEQVASVMAEEAQLEPALARYQALAKSTRDSYKQAQFRIEAAGLEVRLGRNPQAIAHFEQILGGLNPGSWLYRDVRRRIEAVFLGGDDRAGLALYYERWIEKTPDDVEAMARLGTLLAAQGRPDEASAWLAKAVKLAPSRKEIRLALVELLVRDGKVAEAAAQYEAICRAEPGNPDLIRDWGRLLLRDNSRPAAERKAGAAAVWRRLVEGKPDDPVAAARLAELLRQAEMTEEAIAMYQKAIALAPDAPQYREYLGEYYHSLKRTDEALATWRRIADPDRSAKNLARLAEVFAGFGYRDEAIRAIADACRLEPESFDLRLKHADLLDAARRFEEARVELETAATLAGDDAQREATLDRQIKNSQAAGTLADRIKSLRDRLVGDGARDAEGWRRLARYLEADQKADEASAAVGQSLAIDDRSVASWTVRARLLEATRRWGEAADAYRKLTSLDRQGRAVHLASVARIEARLGRRGPALEAGRALLTAAPGNVEHYQFFADLCFQLGETEQGLETLRRATRANPSDPRPLLALAEALARDFRTEEAIELFWRAFEKTSALEAKLDIVSRLADLSGQGSGFDRLVARFERLKGEEKSRREAILCLARAHTTAGDHAAARKELEGLLADNPRDLPLLQQLSALAETEGELEEALSYQKRVDEIAPSVEAATRLAQLYLQAGEEWEADAIWERLASEKQNPEEALRTADRLWASGKYESALRITNRRLRQSPEDWEMLYREARILQSLNRPAEAADRFTALLRIERSDDDAATLTNRNPSTRAAANMVAIPTAVVSSTTRQGVSLAIPPATARLVQSRTIVSPRSPLFNYSFAAGKRLGVVSQIQVEFGMQPGTFVGARNRWIPEDFGQARMAALAGLRSLSRREGMREKRLEPQRDARDRTPHDPRRLRDGYYLQLVLGDPAATYEAALALARVSGADPSAHWWFLTSLPGRVKLLGRKAAEALSATELDQIVTSHSMLMRLEPDWLWKPEGTHWTSLVIEALQRAGRETAIATIYREAMAATSDLSAIAIAADLAAKRDDVEALLDLFDVFQKASGKHTPVNGFIVTPPGKFPSPILPMAQVMHQRADSQAHGDILKILDRYLDFLHRPEQVAGRAKTAYPPPGSPQASVPVWLNPTPRYVRLPYPLPGRTLDFAMILLLRNAFEVYRRDGRSDELIAHIRRPIDEAGGEGKRLYAHLTLSALLAWSEKPQESLEELERAASLPSADPELQLTLAEQYVFRGHYAKGLTQTEAIATTDPALLQRRELLVFQIASLTGDQKRARTAAENLVGLKLPQTVGLQLSGQLRRLGFSDLANRLPGPHRPSTRTRNDPSPQLTSLRKYQAGGRMDAAVQVAIQILRQGSRRNPAAKGEAILVLSRSGKLAEIIKQAEARVERAPQSLTSYLTLAEYYQANGQSGKIPALFEKAARVRPHDARYRIQLANAALQYGDLNAATAHYSAAIKREPALFGERSAEITNLYVRSSKLEELVQVLGDADLKQISSPATAATYVSLILRIPPAQDRDHRLFRKVWEAFPDQRPVLMLAANRERGGIPEVYKYLCEEVIPGHGSAEVSPWQGLEKVLTRSADGTLTTTATQLLDIAAHQNRLGDLARELERAVEKFPAWSGGKALRALIHFREGETEETRRILEKLLADKSAPIPAAVRISLAQRVQGPTPLIPVAISLYEGAIEGNSSDSAGVVPPGGLGISPLVELYLRSDQPAKARDVMLAAVRDCRESLTSPTSQIALSQQIPLLTSAAESFWTKGFLLDALRVLKAVAELSESLTNDRFLTGTDPSLLNLARSDFQATFSLLNSRSLAPTLRTFLKPEPERWGDALDLVLMVDPVELSQAAVLSLPADALRQAARNPKLWAEVKTSLGELVTRYPDDFSVLTTAALAASAEWDQAAIREALGRLDRLVAARPLGKLPEGQHANASQQGEAAKRLGLWLVARECGSVKETRELAHRLAMEAMEAARRQPDPLWLQSMLRLSGQDALDRGDRDKAEAYWTQLLEFTRAVPSPRSGRPTPSATLTPPSGPSTPDARRRPPAIPMVRFQQAMKLARLAGENDLHGLSTRAVRDSLKGGPPFAFSSLNLNGRNLAMGVEAIAGSRATSPTDAVITAIDELVGLWEKHNAPAELVYEALCEVVLPSGQPDRILLYEPDDPVTITAIGVTRTSLSFAKKHLLALLPQWAVRAGKADDLRHRLGQRKIVSSDKDALMLIFKSLENAEMTESPR